MILEYNYGESALRPPAAEICKTTVYLRRNYAETQREGTAFWTYDEAKLSHAEYSEYAKSPEFAEYVAALQTERDALADANSILTGGADIAQPAQAKAYRAKIEAAAQFAPDEIAIMEPSLYRRWTPDWTGKRGDIVRGDDGEGLYRAVPSCRKKTRYRRARMNTARSGTKSVTPPTSGRSGSGPYPASILLP